MAKRYKQSVKGRMSESRGMERYETKKKMGHNPGNGSYDRDHEMKRKEYMGHDMIREDHSQIANLPQDVHMKMYPKMDYLDHSYLNDTAGMIDDQKYMDIKYSRKQFHSGKF